MSDTTADVAPRRSASQWILVAVLAILGILALVAAVLFMTGAANSIHFLSGSVHKGHHAVRMTICLVVGIILLAAAGYFARATRAKPKSLRSPHREAAGRRAARVTSVRGRASPDLTRPPRRSQLRSRPRTAASASRRRTPRLRPLRSAGDGDHDSPSASRAAGSAGSSP